TTEQKQRSKSDLINLPGNAYNQAKKGAEIISGAIQHPIEQGAPIAREIARGPTRIAKGLLDKIMPDMSGLQLNAEAPAVPPGFAEIMRASKQGETEQSKAAADAVIDNVNQWITDP